MKYISHIKDLVSGIIDNDLVTKDTEAYNALVALKNHLDSLKEIYKYMPYQDPGPVIQNLEQSLAQANTRNQELRKQALYLNEEIDQKIKSRDQCYKYWQEYKSKYETLEQKNKELEKTLSNRYFELKSLRAELEDRKLECQELQESDRKAAKEHQQFQSQIEELKEELNEKNSYIEYLKKQTSEAQCDLDNWVNYKGPELEHKIGILEQKLRIAESILTEEQKTGYQEQTNHLDIPGNKSLLDNQQDEISFLIGILSEDQLEEYQEYLRDQEPDDQPQYKIRSKTRPKKRRAN